MGSGKGQAKRVRKAQVISSTEYQNTINILNEVNWMMPAYLYNQKNNKNIPPSKRYLGEKRKEYTSDEINYVLTQLFVDIVLSGRADNDHKKEELSDELNKVLKYIEELSIKVKPMTGGSYFITYELYDGNGNIINTYTPISSYYNDEILNGSILNRINTIRKPTAVNIVSSLVAVFLY